MENFSYEINSLIKLHQEGGYWYFKKEWYIKNADLLHDIICMSNNLENRDAYIIIGVDEEHNYEVVGVKEDTNRKNTQNIVDFLKEKKFAGGIRPTVYVNSLELHKKIIDVIVIKNTNNTPYYLTEHYKGVFANQIYTRIMDTNTPKNQSADIDKIEYLWRKRFRIDETPLQKIEHYITKYNDWETSPNDIASIEYYKYSPEYSIKTEFDESTNGYEFYLFTQCDNRPRWYLITLMYHQTAMKQFQGIALDCGRCFVVAPDTEVFSYTNHHRNLISYKYYIKDSLRYKLNEFFLYTKPAPEEYQYSAYINVILLFETEIEFKNFQEYVLNNKKLYDSLILNYSSEKPDYYQQPDEHVYIKDAFLDDYRNALVFKEMFERYKNSI